MPLYNIYELLLERGVVDRETARVIDDSTNGELSDIVPIPSYTEVYSEVNYDLTIEFLRRKLEIGKVFILSVDELQDKYLTYEEIWRSKGASIELNYDVCPDGSSVCVQMNLANSDIDEALSTLALDYNTAQALLNFNSVSIPPFYLMDDSPTPTINGILSFANSGMYGLVYDAILDNLKGSDKDNMELDTSIDRRFYHFVKLFNSRYTELFFKMISEI